MGCLDDASGPCRTLLRAGAGRFTIRRWDGKITVFWNNIEIGSGAAATPVAKVAIRAQGYYWGQEKRDLFNTVTAEKLVVKTP